LTNTPKGPEKDAAESLDVCPLKQSVEHFITCNSWLRVLVSVFIAAMGVPYLLFTVGILSSIPWDDFAITLGSLVPLWVLLGFIGGPSIFYFILAFAILAYPHKLIVDYQGSLILRSLTRDHCIEFKDIKLITVEQQQNDEGIRSTLGLKIRHSGGIFALSHFADCENFLKALKVAHPAIIIETI